MGGDGREQIVQLYHEITLDGLEAGVLKQREFSLQTLPDGDSGGLRPVDPAESLEAVHQICAGHGGQVRGEDGGRSVPRGDKHVAGEDEIVQRQDLVKVVSVWFIIQECGEL